MGIFEFAAFSVTLLVAPLVYYAMDANSLIHSHAG